MKINKTLFNTASSIYFTCRCIRSLEQQFHIKFYKLSIDFHGCHSTSSWSIQPVNTLNFNRFLPIYISFHLYLFYFTSLESLMSEFVLYREILMRQKKGAPFKFLVPLIYAPVLPLSKFNSIFLIDLLFSI